MSDEPLTFFSGSMGDADRKRVANGAEDAAMSPHSVPDVDMAPNRNNFEKNLWRLNNATESLQTQVSFKRLPNPIPQISLRIVVILDEEVLEQ